MRDRRTGAPNITTRANAAAAGSAIHARGRPRTNLPFHHGSRRVRVPAQNQHMGRLHRQKAIRQGLHLALCRNRQPRQRQARRRKAHAMSGLTQCACGGSPNRRVYDPGPTNAYRMWVECSKCGKATERYLTDDATDTPADGEWNKIAKKRGGRRGE